MPCGKSRVEPTSHVKYTWIAYHITSHHKQFCHFTLLNILQNFYLLKCFGIISLFHYFTISLNGYLDANPIIDNFHIRLYNFASHHGYHKFCLNKYLYHYIMTNDLCFLIFSFLFNPS